MYTEGQKQERKVYSELQLPVPVGMEHKGKYQAGNANAIQQWHTSCTTPTNKPAPDSQGLCYCTVILLHSRSLI